MTIEKVREYLKDFGKDKDIIILNDSTATVELAAKALNTEEGRIAKTLSFKENNHCILIVTAGDIKIDNKKFKTEFGIKAKMLTQEELLEYTGHPIGGVCPFATDSNKVKIFCDVSLKRFNTVFPACGTPNSAIELSCEELYKISGSTRWVDVCKNVY